MDKEVRNIELFKDTITPGHTAFNERNDGGICRLYRDREVVPKNDKPPSDTDRSTGQLNVTTEKAADFVTSYKIDCFFCCRNTVFWCRAPPT